MPAGPLLIYDSALHGLMVQSLPNLTHKPLTAILLSPDHTVDLAGHTVLADVSVHEISNADYRRKEVTGERVEQGAGGPCFHSDTIQFGDPVTLGPVWYMALVFGQALGLKPDSPLLGIAELAIASAVEAQRGAFSISPPAEGWFKLQRG